MECSRCAADLDKQYSYCPSCGYYTNLDYIISCMDDLGLILKGHPDYYYDASNEVDWGFDDYDLMKMGKSDLTKLYSKIEKQNQVLQSWLDEWDDKWDRLNSHIRQKDEKYREQWNSSEWAIEGGLTPEQWEIEASTKFSLNLKVDWLENKSDFNYAHGTDSLEAEKLRARAKLEIEYLQARFSKFEVQLNKVRKEELKRLKKEEDSADFSTRQQGSGELSKFDQLLNSTTSLIAVGLGVVLFLFSSMMIGEVSGAECTVGSSISIEMQDRCTSLANTAKYSMWGGIVSVLYGWYSK